MTPTAEQVEPIEAWLRRTFPGSHVESGGIFDREVYLFRARDGKAPDPAYELEVSYLVFEDRLPEHIIGALERLKVPQRLRDGPHRRLFLNRDLDVGVSAYDPRV